MIDKTEKYKEHYLPGFDCRLTTFRNNLAYYDIEISNGMILGLSGCLIFMYSASDKNSLNISFIAGISNQTLEALTQIYSVHLLLKRYSHSDDIYTDIRNLLSHGFIINILINRPYLDHIRNNPNNAYRVEPYNIGHHFVTITNIDRNNNVTIFETNTSKFFILNPNELKAVWFFDEKYKRPIIDGFLECQGYYYYFTPPKIDAHKDKDLILNSILHVVKNFYQDKDNSFGFLGLKKFFSDIRTWRNNPVLLQKLKMTILVMKVNESLLSGGGLGRKLYSYFLIEVSNLFKDDKLRIIANQFKETSELWSNFIMELFSVVNNSTKNIEQSLFHMDKIIDHYANRIIDAEDNQIKSLYTWLRTN